MLPSERIPYTAIPDRPKLSLPDGARLVVWFIMNVEEWNPRETLPRTVLSPPAGGSPIPDIPNWAWHEYGNRVGFWRMLEVLDHFRIRAVLAINGSAIRTYQPIARAALERSWEFIGHGFGQKNQQAVVDERANIIQATEAIRDFTGRAPRGWLGPGLTETWDTPDERDVFRMLEIDWINPLDRSLFQGETLGHAQFRWSRCRHENQERKETTSEKEMVQTDI